MALSLPQSDSDLAKAIESMRRAAGMAWWFLRAGATALLIGFAVVVVRVEGGSIEYMFTGALFCCMMVGIACAPLHVYEQWVRRRLAALVASGKPPVIGSPWLSILCSLLILAAGFAAIAIGAMRRYEAKRERALRFESVYSGNAVVGHTGSTVVDMNALDKDGIEVVRAAIVTALKQAGYAVDLSGSRGEAVSIIGPVSGKEGVWKVDLTYTEDLYAVGPKVFEVPIPDSPGNSYRLGGVSYRLIRRFAPAGTPVRSHVTLTNGRVSSVCPESGIEAVFPSGFAKVVGDSALIVEDSPAHKALKTGLDRIFALVRQCYADQQVMETDAVAKNRYKQNLDIVNRQMPKLLAQALKAYRGAVVTKMPEVLLTPFGTLASERPACDPAALLKDINRRLSIAGSRVTFTDCKVVDMSSMDKSDIYRLQVRASEAVWVPGDRVSRMNSETNRQLSVSLPMYVPVRLLAGKGDWFGVEVTLADAEQRNPDRISMTVIGEKDAVFESELQGDNRSRLLLVAGSKAETAIRNLGLDLLKIEQALYEDKKRRRHDPAAKARYTANDKTQRDVLANLRKYAKQRYGKILTDLPGLPTCPPPRR